MIVFEGRGDIFACRSQTITCPTNAVGAMGSGLALAFRKRVPGLFSYYVKEFPRRSTPPPDELLHKLLTYRVPDGRQVLLFPTKGHWKYPSKAAWIQSNLITLAHDYEKMGISSLAVPALGCGKGGLDYKKDVRPMLMEYLDPLPLHVEIVLT